jgi:3'(2'), 5'-bisphosphate nucleotidase
MDRTELKILLVDAIEASIASGKEILNVYKSTFEVEYKDDRSPLTIADKKSHNVIMKALHETGIPVLSEEGKDIAFSDRSSWTTLWIVDPLDGTKEFIKQNGEFTVNIGLVHYGSPVLGVIYVPVEETLYFAAEGFGAYRMDQAAHFNDADNIEDYIGKSVKLPENQDRPFTMVGSRSHMSAETADYFEGIREEFPEAELISRGSSLKICMVAEGSADVYPRFAPTMEWDTCAGHAIALEAGFTVVRPDTESPLIYNKENLLNPWFIVKQPGS